MHLVDFMWGVLAIAAAAVPIYRLYDNRHQPGALSLLVLVIACAAYPWAYIIYPHTHFLDQGLVFAITSWIGPVYLLSVFGYLQVQPRGWPWIRNLVLLTGALLSLAALTNPMHGEFATFKAVSGAIPVTKVGQIEHGPGMRLMGGFSIACIIASVIVIGFHYARSRFHLANLLAMTVFPIISGIVYLLQDNLKGLVPGQVNLVILSTTTGLAVLTYALLRGHFLEMRPIARELVLNLIPDAMAVVGATGIVIDCNQRFAGLLGLTVAETIGFELSDHLPADTWYLQGEGKAVRSVQVDLHARSRIFDTHLVSLRDGTGNTLVLLRDTTETTLAHRKLEENQAQLHALNNELARLSNTDSLTGLRNRRFFLDQLSQEHERAARLQQRYALLSIDLDDFKSINDSHGHSAGDEALIHTARVMEQQCRAVDTLARFGGEEFMVMLLGVDEAELEVVGERFRVAIANTRILLGNGERLSLTASIGGALILPHNSVHHALKMVDDALYEAKRAGRNRVVIRKHLAQQTT